MAWKTTFWSAYYYVLDTAIGVTANTLNFLGSLACMAGGVGFSASFAIDETIEASYFGSLDAGGWLMYGLKADQFHIKFNETERFFYHDQKNGGVTYSLIEHVNTGTIRTVSAIFFTSGAVLKVLGANIGHWRQGLEEQRFFNCKYGVEVARPSFREYFFVTAGALLDAVSYTGLTTTIAGSAIHYASLLGSGSTMTYPSEGTMVKGVYYHGPVKSIGVPVDYKWVKNITVKWPSEMALGTPEQSIAFLLEADAHAQGLVNLTYGGGLFFKAHNSPPWALTAPAAVIGSSAYLASQMFFKKAKKERDDRVLLMQQIGDQSVFVQAKLGYQAV